jgi:hypothetical protein
LTTVGFINTKNNFNDSTYKIYSLFEDSLNETRYSNDIESIEDVKKLVVITENINDHLEVLEHNLRYTEFEGNDESFYQIISDLNSYLSQFLAQHNNQFSKKIIINTNLKRRYSKFKTELNILNDYFERINIIRRNRFGVTNYYVVSRDNDFNWEAKMNERLKNIEEIISENQ